MQTLIKPSRLMRPDPSCVLYLPLWLLDAASFGSKDMYSYIVTRTGATWTPQGHSLDGVDDLFTVPQKASINDLIEITIIAVIYPTGWGEGGYGRILDKGQRILMVNNTDTPLRNIQFQHSFSVSGASWATPLDSIALNKWYVVAATYNNSNTTNVPSMYINGISQAVTESVAPVGTASADAANDLIVGNTAATTRSFAGIISLVLYFNRILTAPEILNYSILIKRMLPWL